tara:strand:- start:86 stop:253 length:168 start_codon:yes stop_codon:yes gene_type:complete
VASSVAYINRVEIALGLVDFAAERRTEVGPNQDIARQTGADSQGRAPMSGRQTSC